VTNNCLKPTADRKTRAYSQQKNTYGLLPGPAGSCPGATTGKGGCWHLAAGRKTHTCYVDAITMFRPNVRNLLQHNLDVLKEAKTVKGMAALLTAEFARFRVAELRRRSRTKEVIPLRYRLHWSGDFFSTTYAKAVRLAIEQSPDIEFWTLTRVLPAVQYLRGLKNLILYLSVDPVNIKEMLVYYDSKKGYRDNNLRLAYMSKINDFREAAWDAVPAPSSDRWKWLADAEVRNCPVDSGTTPIDGGCYKCGRCTRNKKTIVWFEA